jgi:hypothetical protein
MRFWLQLAGSFHIVMFAELFKEHNIDAKCAIKYLKNNPEVIKGVLLPSRFILLMEM